MTLHAPVLFTSALLLFWVQPLAVRAVLPAYGGSPLVWNTAMVFFQLTLLAAYSLSHLLTAHLKPRLHAVLLAVLWTAAAATLLLQPFAHLAAPAPLSTHQQGSVIVPAASLFFRLITHYGPAALAVAMLTPLVSSWYTRSHPHRHPYHLFAASNAGSFVILALFTFGLEPLFDTHDQHLQWTALFTCLLIPLAWLAWNTPSAQPPRPPTHDAPQPAAFRPARVFITALVPSALLLAATQHLTTNLAAVPLLWLLPLGIYLLTFVAAFSPTFQRLTSTATPNITRLFVPAIVALTALFMNHAYTDFYQHIFHVFFFALAAYACHTALAALAPAPDQLTRYYLTLSAGGAAGGLLTALAAPLLFNRTYEYPLLFVAAYLVTFPRRQPRPPYLPLYIALALTTVFIYTAEATFLLHHLHWPLIRSSLLTAAIFLTIIALYNLRNARTIFAAAALAVALVPTIALEFNETTYARRTFFGIYRVTTRTHTTDQEQYTLKTFNHGSTNHGASFIPQAGPPIHTIGYYSLQSPYGDAFKALRHAVPTPRTIAIAGLGIGSMACHLEATDTVAFYEIDPVVHDIAHHHFTALQDCPPTKTYTYGDARLTLQNAPPQAYDLIALDAFTSGAIPIHLLTRDAFTEAYLPALKPNGLLVVHISNNYLDLLPPIALIAADLNLSATYWDQDEPPATRPPTHASTVVLITRNPQHLERLDLRPEWQPVPQDLPTPWRPLWRDSHSSILPYLR